MEWIEVTAKTVEEAKDAALDQLGVDEADAEFEVVEAPKGGLFGRLRSEARVRARVLPTTPRPKLDRRDRRRSGGRGGGGGDSARPSSGPPDRKRQNQGGSSERGKQTQSERGAGSSGPPRRRGPAAALREASGTVIDEATATNRDDVAEEFLSGLLDAFGVNYTIERRRLEEDTTELAVQGNELGLLIGQKGSTLQAVQELTRTVVQRNLPTPHGRIVVDVAGYRQARRAALERFTREVAAEVVAGGVPRVLEPMPPADRKVIHDTVNTIAGAGTLSEGEEPRRRVVITPDSSSDSSEGEADTGPSGPTEREVQGPSGPSEPETQAPAEDAEETAPS